MKENIEGAINRIREKLRQDQSPNGSWNYAFETGISTDAYMIILLRTLEINDEILVRELSDRMISKQEKNGAWKLFHDEGDGNLTATIDAYYALRYSGYFDKNDLRLVAARKFILANGGLDKANMFTKMLLSLTGQLSWPTLFPIPIEMILLPQSFPLNFYSFSVYGRVNLCPMMILADRKPRFVTEKSPNLAELSLHQVREEHFDEWRSITSFIKKGIQSLVGLPEQLNELATARAKQYIIERIEPDGTLYSYFSSTFLMIFALLSLGFKKNDPLILHAIKGLIPMKTTIKGRTHLQFTTASVWNTGLISTALQSAGVSPKDRMIKSANRYLLQHQHVKYGDWVEDNRDGVPGGWGFSDVNTMNPDVDDTTAALRALAKRVHEKPSYKIAWDRGLKWLFSMQNADGGWPAFERNKNSKLLQFIPVEKGEFLLSDPTCADLTGRTLEFLGTYTNLSKTHSSIKKAVQWLIDHQEEDGSWYGRWGICYLYGTWAALTGLRAVGVSSTNSSVMKAVEWIKKVQNPDGGWGESCHSDIQKKYVPLGASNLTHTAWALDSLMAVSDHPTKEIQAGMEYLLLNLSKNDWTAEYPVGQGMAGGLYIHYHSYRYLFPLMTLGHYKRKYL
ncbi:MULTISPECIES: squalene--hopene cyclase [unclassified Bacillus (in: firmicutes)]|uniref:squalene--hopene cyclase n=1 Tax=unclassified Bacillus (in: firmicutes) TaxID=185979 RepID=UPI0008E3D215|nr:MULTISPECIES: squalene--hopene cyclase [unclassified Bacillus (in: firmicutes)]SFA86786.1 sporulenol synthase [Bacillus sp. UNCCL13]SFQ83877.1 sporulene cyclase [Bacillus sp. cl95]